MTRRPRTDAKSSEDGYHDAHEAVAGTSSTRVIGVITRVLLDKKFAFARLDGDDGREYFVHITAMEDEREFQQLRQGSRVSMTTYVSAKGPRAAEVRLATGNE